MSERSYTGSAYADLVRELHQAADEYDRGHGPLHACAANAIEHLTTLLRDRTPAQGSPSDAAADLEHVRSALATLSDPLSIVVDGHLTGTTRALAIVHAMRDIAATAALRLPHAVGCTAQEKPTRADRLEDERNALQNSYGRGPFSDGLITQRIAAIDKELSAISSTERAE